MPGLRQSSPDVQAVRRRAEGGEPGQCHVHGLAGRDAERGRVPMIGRVQTEAADRHRIGTGHGDHLRCVAGSRLAHPRHGPGVVEAEPQFDVELHRPRHPHHPADDVGAIDPHLRVGIDRHEVVYLRNTGRGVPPGDEDERVIVVMTRRPHPLHRSQRPRTVIRITEQHGEHRRGVQPWKAQPVDAAVTGDERGGTTVAEHRIVRNRSRHTAMLARPRPSHATGRRGGLRSARRRRWERWPVTWAALPRIRRPAFSAAPPAPRREGRRQPASATRSAPPPTGMRSAAAVSSETTSGRRRPRTSLSSAPLTGPTGRATTEIAHRRAAPRRPRVHAVLTFIETAWRHHASPHPRRRRSPPGVTLPAG